MQQTPQAFLKGAQHSMALSEDEIEAAVLAMIEKVKEANAIGQPVLVGTTSIEKSEMLSQMLTEAGITHNVLNARQHEQEAQIVADAGKFGAVTIAGKVVWWKIDIFDADYAYGAEDPLDDAQTRRVLTRLFPSEY